MKKTFLYLVMAVFAMVVFNSCSSDREDKNNSIIGKWILESYIIYNFEGTGYPIDDSQGVMPRPIFEFKDNGIFRYNLMDGSPNIWRELTYTVSDGKIYFSDAVAFEADVYDYEFSGGKLILKNDHYHPDGPNSPYNEHTVVTLTK